MESSPVSTAAHLVTLLTLGRWTAATGLLLGCPRPAWELAIHVQCHSYCTLWALLSAGPASSLQLVLWAALQDPRALGDSDQRVLKVGACKLRMRNNPSVTRIRFHQCSSDSLYSLEAPPSPTLHCIFSCRILRLSLGGGESDGSPKDPGQEWKALQGVKMRQTVPRGACFWFKDVRLRKGPAYPNIWEDGRDSRGAGDQGLLPPTLTQAFFRWEGEGII